VTKGSVIHELEAYGDERVTVVVFSPNGSRVASGTESHEVMIWDSVQGKLIKIFKEHNSYITELAWSPDGKRLASSNGKGGISIRVIEEGPKPAAVNAPPKKPDGKKGIAGTYIEKKTGWKYVISGNGNAEVFFGGGFPARPYEWEIKNGRVHMEPKYMSGTTIYKIEANGDLTSLDHQFVLERKE